MAAPLPGRGLHSAQAEATAIVETSRASVGALLPPGRVVVFTSGTTAALSQAILGLLPAPRNIACDPLAHNAVRRPIARLAHRGAKVSMLPHDREGRVVLVRAARGWVTGIDLMVVTHGPNLNGVVQPVAELVAIAHAQGARVIVDAAQTAGRRIARCRRRRSGCVLRAHKGLAALVGIGVLAVRGSVELEPLVVGGTGFDSQADDMPVELPGRLEAGTPNLPGIAALGVAAEYARAHPFAVEPCTEALHAAIRKAGLVPIAPGAPLSPTVPTLPVALVRVPGLSAIELEDVLDRVFGIATCAGTQCAPAAHELLRTGGEGALRISAGRSTTSDDLPALSEAIRALTSDPALAPRAGPA